MGVESLPFGRSDAAEEDKNEENDQNRSDDAGRSIAPAAAMRPSGYDADEDKDENDDEYGAHDEILSKIREMAFTWEIMLKTGESSIAVCGGSHFLNFFKALWPQPFPREEQIGQPCVLMHSDPQWRLR